MEEGRKGIAKDMNEPYNVENQLKVELLSKIDKIYMPERNIKDMRPRKGKQSGTGSLFSFYRKYTDICECHSPIHRSTSL